MPEYTHKNHRFGIQTPLGDDVLLLSRFDGDEPISGLFAYNLELVSLNDSIEASSIVGQSVRFWVQHPDDEYRFYQGHVSQFQYIGRDDRLSRYRALVVPWLWFLTLNSDCRIFQNMTLPQIVSKVLKDRGCTDFENSQITGSYTPLEYCVQYNESDFTFISRLMEEAGIFYYFRHDEDRLVLVLADSMAGCETCKDGQEEFTDNLSERTLSNPIWKWVHRYEFRPGKWTHKDFNFKSPRSEMLAEVPTLVDLPGNKKFEVYQYPGRYDQRSDGASYARIRMQAEEAAVDIVDGQSHCRSFSPGVRFTMVRHHSSREQGKSYIVTAVCHSFDASDVFVTGRSSPSRGYSNSFTCIPDSVTFRPPRETPLARVRGPQTAIVVGPKGEEIYTDEFGRVKVQFHWDREGQQNEHSSCWMRVSQVHAGAGWGMMDLPRVGEEVIVSFLEGDPDRPIITGRVYNGDNMPPFSLPAGKTRRGNMTKTYKGAGYNEMSMDDTPGKEQLRMNAQYDMNSNVNNDQTLDVGKNQTEKVGVDRTREVGNNEKVTVGVNKSVKVGTNHDETVGVNQKVDVGTNQSTSVGSTQTNSVGMMKNETVGMMSNEMVGVAKTLNVGAAYSIISGGVMNVAVGFAAAEEVGSTKKIIVGSKLEITCGASKLTMDAGGKITLEGTEILLSASGPVKISGSVVDLN
jgi:type VI secretion system secreted protein VgrG